MTTTFLHGVNVIEIDNGTRPIRTVRSSVIGLVGTAPDADTSKFPANTPVMIAGKRSEAAPLGTAGTLPSAMDDIFDQCGAIVVVVRVEEGADEATTISNIIGGVDSATGQYLGMQALLGAKSQLGVQPRLLIAPQFTQEKAVTTEFISIAERLMAHIVVDGPNSNDADAMAYRGQFDTRRIYLVDPWERVWDTQTSTEVVLAASASAAGLIARVDAEYGFWVSPSNKVLYGIVGTARPVDFTLGDANSRANLLNEKDVATIINHNGYRLWGNRTCAVDKKWAFLNVSRTADMIHESIMQAHLWAIDRNITRTYLAQVVDGVNAYLRDLKAQGAIIDGEAWADPELNTPEQIADGKVKIDFKFSANYPAENIQFRSHLVNDYLTEVLPKAA